MQRTEYSVEKKWRLVYLAGNVPAIGCLLTDGVATDVRVCQRVEEGGGVVGWMEERCGMEVRHGWGVR